MVDCLITLERTGADVEDVPSDEEVVDALRLLDKAQVPCEMLAVRCSGHNPALFDPFAHKLSRSETWSQLLQAGVALTLPDVVNPSGDVWTFWGIVHFRLHGRQNGRSRKCARAFTRGSR